MAWQTVVADSLDSGLARAPSAEFIKDRAVGAVIAFAGGDQAAQHLNDAPMCLHAGHDFLLVTIGQDANLAARSPPIAHRHPSPFISSTLGFCHGWISRNGTNRPSLFLGAAGYVVGNKSAPLTHGFGSSYRRVFRSLQFKLSIDFGPD